MLPGVAEARHRRHVHLHFTDDDVRPLNVVPRPETEGEKAAYAVGGLSGLLVQGIGGATSALPAPSYPSAYGALAPGYRGN